MKTKIATAILSLTAALGFAQDTVAPMSTPKLNDRPAKSTSFGYVQMSVSDSDAINQFETVPGIGAGYRWALGSGALDFSANYTREIKAGDNEHFTSPAPKVSYLQYWDSKASNTAYAGLGLGWTGIRKAEVANFDGAVATASIGYEANRHQTVRTFAQLDVSQPVAAVRESTIKFDNLPKLSAALSLGLGF